MQHFHLKLFDSKYLDSLKMDQTDQMETKNKNAQTNHYPQLHTTSVWDISEDYHHLKTAEDG